MSFVIPSSSALTLHFSLCNISNLNSEEKFTCHSFRPILHRMVPCCKTRYMCISFRNEPNTLYKYAARCKGPGNESFTEESTISMYGDDEYIDGDDKDIEDTGSPWEGAVIYKRDPIILHLEYCITLERLGLGKLSTDVSKNRASSMGLRLTKAVKDYPHGTPVHISIDVTRKKKKLRLDGIIKTVITLLCHRCCMPCPDLVFSEFSLLLTEEPIEELETIDLGVIYGEDVFTTSGNSGEDDDDDALIDLDDRLHFPHEEKEIDISKPIRDRVHIEINMNAVCNPGCKGLCLKCGQDLNTGSCNCSKLEEKEKNYGPLGKFKGQMQL